MMPGQKRPAKSKLWLARCISVLVIALSAGHCMSVLILLYGEGSPALTLFLRPRGSWDRSTDAVVEGEHGMKGARDVNGVAGFVADASTDRLASFRSHHKQCSKDNYEIEGQGGQKLLDKIRGGLVNARVTLEKYRKNSVKVPRILCLVYTVDTAKNRENLLGVVDTWAKQCDGFIAASNVTDDDIGAIDLLHEGPEEYGNMWQKVRSMWKYAYDNYIDKFDYFHICGDDVYLILDNLRLYAMSDQVGQLLEGKLDRITRYHMDHKRVFGEIDFEARGKQRPRPLLLGMPQVQVRTQLFASGGPGYTLNRAALRLLAEKGLKQSFAPINNMTDSREDVLMGDVMRPLGVTVADTRDEEGSWRYLMENAEIMQRFHFTPLKFLGKDLHRGGLEEWSKQSVSIHVKKHRRFRTPFTVRDTIYRYHDLLEGRCS